MVDTSCVLAKDCVGAFEDGVSGAFGEAEVEDFD